MEESMVEFIEEDKETFKEAEEYIEEDVEILPKDKAEQEVSHPKVIVAQVPDSSKFFTSPSQVYEIQIIEIPIQSMIKHS